jgi:hypothetical protein
MLDSAGVTFFIGLLLHSPSPGLTPRRLAGAGGAVIFTP